MLPLKKETSVEVVPTFPLTGVQVITDEDYAIQKFAETGRTVMVTRRGDCPIVPFEEHDERRDVKYLIKVADEAEIVKLKRVGEMRKRFEILESVPYTDIIVAHEQPKPKKEIDAMDIGMKISYPITIPLELIKAIAGPLGAVISIVQFAVVGVFSLIVALVGLAMGCAVAVAMVDPIVWARIDDGSDNAPWIQIADWEE